jgi:hypothetical protein
LRQYQKVPRLPANHPPHERQASSTKKLGFGPQGTKARFPVNRFPPNVYPELVEGQKHSAALPRKKSTNLSASLIGKFSFLKIYREAIPQFYILHFDF